MTKGMVIVRTPFRISLFGGGTDLEDYFSDHNGMVIGMAINKYLYVTVNSLERMLEQKIRLSYSKLENVEDVSMIDHDIARTILTYHPAVNEKTFLDIHTFADLPNSSGVGSSSAFTVGLLNALYFLNGVYKTPQCIAQEAIFVERKQLKHSGGWQDQIFSSCGGFNKIHFSSSEFVVEPMCLPKEKIRALQDSCCLFFTGQTRSSSEAQKRIEASSIALRNERLARIYDHAQQAFEVFTTVKDSRDMLQEIGRLLHESWVVKRSLDDAVSNDTINQMYERGIKAGAIGGKLCGAGGGGFILFIVPPEKKTQLIAEMAPHNYMQFEIDSLGSKLIYSCHL